MLDLVAPFVLDSLISHNSILPSSRTSPFTLRGNTTIRDASSDWLS
uniref:Uncharacterized protein n=1 Tax=Anguilla anguilla TaxID=7936 RepID=A0A0E9TAB2_ANGAN